MAKTRTMSTYEDSVWDAEAKLFAETGKHWRPGGTFMDVTLFEETDLTLEELKAEAEAEGRKWAQWLPEGPPTHSWARCVDPEPNVSVDSAHQPEEAHANTIGSTGSRDCGTGIEIGKAEAGKDTADGRAPAGGK